MKTPLERKTALKSVAWVLAASLVLAGCGAEKPSGSAATKPKQAKPQPAKTEGKKDEHGAEEGSLVKLTDDEAKAAGIRVQAIASKPILDTLAVTATIQANQDRMAQLAPRVSGRVVRVAASLGDVVKQGQVLATLDSIEIGEARSAFQQAASEARVTRAALDRAERLQGEQIISQKDFLRSRAENEKAQAALRAAQDKLRALGLGGAASDGASEFAVTAPFAGTVIDKKAVVGELAQPDKPLFAVADLSTLWIEANLMEKDLGRVKVGDEAVVTVEAYPKDTFPGRLTYIGGMLDKETRTIRGRILVKNTDGRLKPEMFATAAIRTAAGGDGMVVPDEAVVLLSGKPAVFVEEGAGFEARPVELGQRVKGAVVVTAGIKPDDLVVVAGAYALKARMLKSKIGAGHAH